MTLPLIQGGRRDQHPHRQLSRPDDAAAFTGLPKPSFGPGRARRHCAPSTPSRGGSQPPESGTPPVGQARKSRAPAVSDDRPRPRPPQRLTPVRGRGWKVCAGRATHRCRKVRPPFESTQPQDFAHDARHQAMSRPCPPWSTRTKVRLLVCIYCLRVEHRSGLRFR
jgi:hypothetical protein